MQTQNEKRKYELDGVQFSTGTLDTLSILNEIDSQEMKNAIANLSLSIHLLKDFQIDEKICFLLKFMYEYYDRYSLIKSSK